MSTNMYTEIYNCLDDIHNFKIRVKFKRARSIVTAPQTETGSFRDNFENENLIAERMFLWQEKVFSQDEIEFYKNEKNCLTDLEKKYNSILKNIDLDDYERKLFSYVHEDDFDLMEESVTTENRPRISELQKQMNALRIGKVQNTAENKQSNFSNNINEVFDSNPYKSKSREIMYIMVDLGAELSLNKDILSKSQHVLCTLEWEPQSKVLTMYPDFSKDDDPYVLEVQGDFRNIYHYWIEHVSADISADLKVKEFDLLKKLSAREFETKQKKLALHDFVVPNKNELIIYVFGEIISARQFEYENLYVQYVVDLPENWAVLDGDVRNLSGRTQSAVTNDKGTATFGFLFELALVYNFRKSSENIAILKSPTIYFEIRSKESWDRHRTEGFCYASIPVNNPGPHHRELSCLLVKPKGHYGDLRRFFIGGCTNLDDITWLGIPNNHKEPVLNKYGIKTESTGYLQIKLNVIRQSQSAIINRRLSKTVDGDNNGRSVVFEHNDATSLVSSVEQVLLAFKRARQNMNRARKNIEH